MATAPTPTPTPEPARSSIVVCPSCGSKHNTETRELVESTRLPERIADLEGKLATLRGANAQLTNDLAAANQKIVELSAAPIPAPAPPEPRRGKNRDFIVGER